MNTLSSYSPIQQLTLTRYGRLKMLHRDVLPQLDPTDYRVKLTLKALYSTYEDLRELGLDNEARLLLGESGPRNAAENVDDASESAWPHLGESSTSTPES
jgi:hypothetical protein